ncbi:uncharacterized protein METZ01_LOCUS239929 [marine metagenome]|uniref:Uncharacterized protein n=1 Tax=marine metagenome TaxID=408172 RepID=A0A382HJ31_9ZZZZ
MENLIEVNPQHKDSIVIELGMYLDK